MFKMHPMLFDYGKIATGSSTIGGQGPVGRSNHPPGGQSVESGHSLLKKLC